MADVEIEYQRWATEQLLGLFNQEEERRRSLENKAAIAATVSLAFGSFAFSQGSVQPPLNAVAACLAVASVCCSIATLIHGYRAVAVSGASVPKPELLVGHELFDLPATSRHACFSEHLMKTINEVRKELEIKAKDSYKAQQWSIISAIAYLGLLGAVRLF